MQKDILISVIVPVYNLENYIERTLDNIIKQMHNDIELIIVNDGSTDNSANMIDMIIQQHKHLNIKIIHQENQGVSKARNIGIDNAIGKYIYFLDGDDIVNEFLFDEIRTQNDFDYLIFGFDTVNEKLETLTAFRKKYIYPKNLNQLKVLEWFLLKNFTICIGSAVYKKEIIINNNLNFGEKYKYGEDISFFIKYLAHAKNIKVIEKSLMYYVMRSGSAIDSLYKPNYKSIEAYEECYIYLRNMGFKEKIYKLIHTCLIPGSVLAQNIRLIKQKEFTKHKIPKEILSIIQEVNAYDLIVRKKKRGVFLYIGILMSLHTPKIFEFLVNIRK